MTLYYERMWPTPWIFVITALVIPASILVFLPINPLAGYITAGVLYVGIVLFLSLTSPIISVTHETLRAGQAAIPVEFTGETRSFLAGEAVLERGVHLDARAWLVIRGWISPVVKVTVTDPADPVPYWLLSSRHPDRLEAALAEAKTGAPADR
ncbi:hypothetical protein B7R54_18880 [Subtercola boreus]|uniref:DUF3093 domain-containing protein n=1 Tax=Subtercola boreus TaxID=120213 RepID=A0A3E0VA33_9MICO|nr:DUF3093 domain-containing protein [Subtercola boreus]RFA06445.1 hypothetical protein B7R54_18880 [Subtercola boreus]TQL46890.1 DUF3093 family protein [Subtercola boreus]